MVERDKKDPIAASERRSEGRPDNKQLNTATVSWQGEEYVPHDKNFGWYVGLIIVGLLFVALSVALQWWTFTALIVLSVIALLLYAIRPPRKLNYTLSSDGLQEGDKLYRYDDFKSFGVMKDGAHFAIVLTPRKRFSPAVTVYFPESQGEKIVDMFGVRLPMAEVRLDLIDKLVRLLRI